MFISLTHSDIFVAFAQLLNNVVVVGGSFTLGQLQNGAVLPTLAGQNITVQADFPPSDPDRAVRAPEIQLGGMFHITSSSVAKMCDVPMLRPWH